MGARASRHFIGAASLALVLAAASSAASIRADTSAYPTIGVTVVLAGDPGSPPPVFEDGRRVKVTYAADFRGARTIALVVDRSRSMHGQALDTARAVARKLSVDRQPGDRIALFAVGSRAVRLTRFTHSPLPALKALRHLRIDRRYGTALYDGIALAAGAMQRAHVLNGMIILVTDGQDTTSSVGITEATADAAEAHAPIYPIGIRNGTYRPGVLNTLAQTTFGAFFGAASSDSALESIAAHIRGTWRLEYRTAALPGELVKIRVADHGSRPLRVRVTMPGRQPGNPWRWRELAALISIAAFFLVLLIAVVTRRRRPLRDW